MLHQLFEEALYSLYRLLFILYAESRDLLPVGESPVYRDTYSLEHLREMAERPLHPEDADKTYYIETLRALFKMLHQGFPPPGSALNPGFEIPPFNGQLFDPRRTALLDRCRVPDRAMRQVIRELSLSRPRRRDDRRERYSYADLGVDQLGSIYEGLLVYEPAIVDEETVVARVKGEERLVTRAQAEEYGLEIVEDSLKRPGSFVLRLWGGRRKGTGSYYTPQEITSFLVKEALEPLVEPIVQGCAVPQQRGGERDRRRRPKRRPEEILELKVCDPAMGSGAFLIQACRYLAEAYGRARIAAGLDEDRRISQEEFARYKRRVAEKCLYGVDLNPLAVELAKVSLWLETLARDRPLTFLDAHLRCGNSLIGAPLRDESGNFTVERLSFIPDEALQEVSKEATKKQKAAARERIQRNRMERARAGRGDTPQRGMWDQQYADAIQTALADTLTRRLDLEVSDEDLPMHEAVELVQEKEHLFDALQHAADSRYRQAKQICDLWCAAWFWPEPGSPLPVEGEGPGVRVPPPPTTQVFLELASHILDTDPGSLTEAEREAYLRAAEQVAQEQRFFHWELEFPEVWREKDGRPKKNGGFDAVVGNPPWVLSEPDLESFLWEYSPADALVVHSRSQFANEQLVSEWGSFTRSVAAFGNWCRTSRRFPVIGRGKLNLYGLFSIQFALLTRAGGSVSGLLPSQFYHDKGSRPIREFFWRETKVRHFLVFENRRGYFPIHRSYKFLLLVAELGESTTLLPCAFTLGDLQVLTGIESRSSPMLNLDISLVARFSPDSGSLMEFANQQDIDLTTKIYRAWPLLADTLSEKWNVEFHQGELNKSTDSEVFASKGLPHVDVGTFGQFGMPWKQPELYVDPYLLSRKAGSVGRIKDEPYKRFRCAIRLLSRNTDHRTLIATVLPRGYTLDHNVAYTDWFAEDGTPLADDDEATVLALYLTGLLNSLTVDWIQRQKAGAYIGLFRLKQLPIPRGEVPRQAERILVLDSCRLVARTQEYDALRQIVGKRYPGELPASHRPDASSNQLPARAQFRAEIDALVADLYGLSEEDFAYILTTFPLLDRDQPALPDEPKSTITRDLALLALFKLRGVTAPADIVDFFTAAGADISGITGPLRDLEQRVVEGTRLGAVAYIPSGRGGEMEVELEEAEAQLELFEED